MFVSPSFSNIFESPLSQLLAPFQPVLIQISAIADDLERNITLTDEKTRTKYEFVAASNTLSKILRAKRF